MLNPSPAVVQTTAATAPPIPNPPSHFLLAGLLEELSLQSGSEQLRLDRSHFVQQLVLSTLVCRKDQEKPKVKEEGGKPEEVAAARGHPPSGRILRGRARSSSSNALSRADANKGPSLCKGKNNSDEKPENGVSR